MKTKKVNPKGWLRHGDEKLFQRVKYNVGHFKIIKDLFQNEVLSNLKSTINIKFEVFDKIKDLKRSGFTQPSVRWDSRL